MPWQLLFCLTYLWPRGLDPFRIFVAIQDVLGINGCLVAALWPYQRAQTGPKRDNKLGARGRIPEPSQLGVLWPEMMLSHHHQVQGMQEMPN